MKSRSMDHSAKEMLETEFFMSNWRLLIVNFAGSSVKRRPGFGAQKGTYAVARLLALGFAHRKLVASALEKPCCRFGLFKSPVSLNFAR